MTKTVNEREIVLAVLMEVTENGMYSHVILRDVLAKYQYLEKKERAFITRVTDGTLENMIEIDYILDQFSKVKVKKMKPVIRNILRSAVYQLKYMDSVPDRAVCSEAVKLAARRGFSGLKGYVNGVLRSIARGLDSIEYPADEVQYLSVKYSCPEWIVQMWQKTYSRDVVEKMLGSFRGERPLTIRCCLNRTTPEELVKELEKEGVTAVRHPYLPYAFEITGYDYLESLESFRKGLFCVQDVSSMLVGELSRPVSGAQVIDVCAAPGGKALHVAEQLSVMATDPGEPQGSVVARDLTEYKVGLIRENIVRSGLSNINAVCQDACVPVAEDRGQGDLVVADLPCSGLGVLGRKADLKYRASKDGIRELAALQRKILSCVQEYVKTGGTLMYSTCTVSQAENEENVRWFLEKYPEFELDDIRDMVCSELRDSVAEEGWLQLLPGVHKCDGFFIARFVRR